MNQIVSNTVIIVILVVAFYMSPASMILCVLFLLIGYAFVSVVDYIRIKRIPMDVALKNVE